MDRRFHVKLPEEISDFIRGYAFKYDISFTGVVTQALLLLAEREREKFNEKKAD